MIAPGLAHRIVLIRVMCDDVLGFTQNSVVHAGARGFAMGFTIALIVHSLDPSLSAQLILFGHLITHLIPSYGLGVVRLSAQRNCCAFAQSRA